VATSLIGYLAPNFRQQTRYLARTHGAAECSIVQMSGSAGLQASVQAALVREESRLQPTTVFPLPATAGPSTPAGERRPPRVGMTPREELAARLEPRPFKAQPHY
jgi:hypothetical protein